MYAQYLLENRVRAFRGSAVVYGVFVDLLTLWWETNFNVPPCLRLSAVLLCPKPDCDGISTSSFEILTSSLLQPGAWSRTCMCAAFKRISPLNNVDIHLPWARYTRDGSKANDRPPSPAAKSCLPSAAQRVVLQLRRKQSKTSDPEGCYTRRAPLREEYWLKYWNKMTFTLCATIL